MAGHKKDAPGHFAQMVALAIRDEMETRDMSGRALSRRLGMSEKYVRERLALKFEFSLNDVQEFCLYIGINPEEFVGNLEREAYDDRIEYPTIFGDDEDDVSGLPEDDVQSRYATAANTDFSADDLDPDTP